LQFSSATHILKVNCAEMAENGHRQPAYELFSIVHIFFTILGSRSLPYKGLKFWCSFKTHYYSIARCTQLPR